MDGLWVAEFAWGVALADEAFAGALVGDGVGHAVDGGAGRAVEFVAVVVEDEAGGDWVGRRGGAASICTKESLRNVEQQFTNLPLTGKQIDTYCKLKPIYARYKASKGKEKFLRGSESEIILFEAAAREINKAGLTKLPSTENLQTELAGLAIRKTSCKRNCRRYS